VKGLTVEAGRRGSAALEELPEPAAGEGEVLVETLSVGVCGTDREILAGLYGAPPAGRQRLVLGHEAVGRVLEAPEGGGLRPGDLVVPIVRHPDPVPCESCAAGEWDLCRNGRFTEHGIKGRDGFCRERWRCRERSLVKLDARLAAVGALVETASVLAKAWERVDVIFERVLPFKPARALVTGAGPVGLLAALMGRQRGLEVAVLDRNATGPKPGLAAGLGASYRVGAVAEACPPCPDILIECTGAGRLVLDAIASAARDGVVCLTGVSGGRQLLPVDAAALNKNLVLENATVFGSVNANRRHYEAGVKALLAADPAWLAKLVTRRVPLSRWSEALEKRQDDVKVLVDFAA
jgi:threonine dehydrogenase-like Zn-dependent dehydrogenase